MIKKILVPNSGIQATDTVFATALSVATTLAAHLTFFHGRYDAYDRAAQSTHLDFCDNKEVSRAILASQRSDADLSKSARANFGKFCDINRILVSSVPSAPAQVTADCIEGTGRGGFLYHARHSDLVVLGRHSYATSSSDERIEQILLESGRPIIIAPEIASFSLTDTVVVGWTETPEAARALAAAMPLLTAARRVIVMHVVENENGPAEGLRDVVSQLAWHGVAAEARLLTDTSKPVAQLVGAALENHAGLVVIGGYGHMPLGEAIFGGVTRTLVQHSDFAVLLTH